MNNLSRTDILSIIKVLSKHMHHDCSIRSSSYKEIGRIIDLLTDALVATK